VCVLVRQFGSSHQNSPLDWPIARWDSDVLLSTPYQTLQTFSSPYLAYPSCNGDVRSTDFTTYSHSRRRSIYTPRMKFHPLAVTAVVCWSSHTGSRTDAYMTTIPTSTSVSSSSSSLFLSAWQRTADHYHEEDESSSTSLLCSPSSSSSSWWSQWQQAQQELQSLKGKLQQQQQGGGRSYSAGGVSNRTALRERSHGMLVDAYACVTSSACMVYGWIILVCSWWNCRPGCGIRRCQRWQF
jgi:hypothetical protein